MEQFTFVKRGYDPEEVDKYITTLEQVIKSYKDKDNAIKNAIISAQRTAEDVVKNAQAEAETYKAQMGEQLIGMRGTLDRQRVSLQNFQDVNANAIRKCIQELEKFDMNEMFSRIDEMDAAIAALQGLETMNKDRLLQSQNTDPRGLPRDIMQDMIRRDPGQEPREREHGYSSPSLPPPLPRDSAPMRDLGRDVMRAPVPYDNMMREIGRDMRGNDMDRPPREAMRDTGMDMMRARTAHSPQDIMRDSKDMSREPYAPQEPYRGDMMGRDMMPPYASQDTMRDRDMMRDDNRDMMRQDGRDYVPEQQREIARDTRRDSRNDFGRDIRRDYGRDMRSDTGRGRDDYRDGMGRLEREPMRDMDRRYTSNADSYDDNDQNLLPPVASLM